MTELLQQILEILEIKRLDLLPYQILTVDRLLDKQLNNAYEQGYKNGFENGKDVWRKDEEIF